jgi:hypothetical protein
MQGSVDISKGLFGLLDDIGGDGHRVVVESGRAGDKNPLAVNDSS